MTPVGFSDQNTLAALSLLETYWRVMHFVTKNGGYTIYKCLFLAF